MRVLVDTNVFLDVLCKREGLVENSKAFFDLARIKKDQIYVAASTIKDLGYFIKKRTHDDKITNDTLVKIYTRIGKIVGVTADDAINALYEDGDYEDNVLAFVCQTTMCDAIITNNKKDFLNKNVVPLTPAEYLRIR